MQVLGFLLLVLALVAGIVGIVQHMKGKKLLAAPFKGTGELAQAGNHPGNVSCEGRIVTQTPMQAPCSGRPCVYYEVELVRQWQKTSMTENGAKTEKGKETVSTDKKGTMFFVDDGSGPVAVDANQGVDGDLEQSFEQHQNAAWGNVVFGGYQTTVGPMIGDKTATGLTAIERIIAPDGNLFVLGKLANGAITKPDGMLAKLKASRKGRDALLGSAKKLKMAGFIAAGVLFVPGALMAALGEPMKAGPNACDITDQTLASKPCTGKITGDSGTDVPLTITQKGTYEIRAHAPTGKKIPLMPVITVKDATGKQIEEHDGEKLEIELDTGKYTLNVRDSVDGAAKAFKGGFSFELEVEKTASATATTASSAAAPSDDDAPKADTQDDDDKKPTPTATAKKPAAKPTAAAKPAPAPAAKPAPAPAAKPAPAPAAKPTPATK